MRDIKKRKDEESGGEEEEEEIKWKGEWRRKIKA